MLWKQTQLGTGKKKNTQADKCNLNPKIFQWPQLFGHEETKLDFYLYVTS